MREFSSIQSKYHYSIVFSFLSSTIKMERYGDLIPIRFLDIHMDALKFNSQSMHSKKDERERYIETILLLR